MMYLPFADVYMNLPALVLAGVCTGLLSGVFGVSAAFLLTPLLHALGFPMTYAVGTTLTCLFGRAVLTTVKNNALHHVHWKLGILTGATSAVSIYLGKTFLLSSWETGAADTAAGVLYMVVLSGACLFMLWGEARHKRPDGLMNTYARVSSFAEKVRGINLTPMIHLSSGGGKSISFWFLAALGTVTGLLSGLLGLSGSSVRLPALVFFAGLPVIPALCTDILATLITTGAGSAVFAISGQAEIVAAMVLLLCSSVGSAIGHWAVRHVNRAGLKLAFKVQVAAVLAGVVLTQLGYPALAVVMSLGPVLLMSATGVLGATLAILRANRPAVGFPIAKKIISGEE